MRRRDLMYRALGAGLSLLVAAAFTPGCTSTDSGCLLTSCGADCVALGTDPNNCGACGHVCSLGCSKGACNCTIAPQAGCDAGQACYLSGGCFATGKVPDGAACSQENDCAPGATCGNGACHPVTCDPDCGYYLTPCDLVNAAMPGPGLVACGAGAKCTLVGGSSGDQESCDASAGMKGGDYGTDCRGPLTSLEQGATCTSDLQCPAGYGCGCHSWSANACVRWCAKDGDCPTGGWVCDLSSPARVDNGVVLGNCTDVALCTNPTSTADCKNCLTRESCTSINTPTCCEKAIPTGPQKWVDVFNNACACKAGSPCQAACASAGDLCADPTAMGTPGCNFCLNHLLSGDPCWDVRNSDCAADAICDAYVNCYLACGFLPA